MMTRTLPLFIIDLINHLRKITIHQNEIPLLTSYQNTNLSALKLFKEFRNQRMTKKVMKSQV